MVGLVPFLNEILGKSLMNPNQVISMRSKKSVTFHEKVKVHLIPSRHEYIIRGMVKDLWYSIEDFRQGQGEAQSELIKLAFNEKISLKDAKKLLYQHSMDDYALIIAEHEKVSSAPLLYSHKFTPIFSLIPERSYSEVCR